MVITTGITESKVLCRLEIHNFLQDKDVTNLFILAMDQMMRIKQEDQSSWFQIAAIHGRPYIPFDNVGTKGSFGGYCCHSSILFPSWHRPYLALYEQSLSKHVHEIALEYKNPEDKKRYTEAADRFRIPYWDWATEPVLPDIIATQEKVSVHIPDGSITSIKNPLFGYFFNPVYSDFGDGLPDEKVWESWRYTVRYPTTNDAKAESDPTKMQATLKVNQSTLRDRTYNILTQIKNYNLFSHDASGGAEHPPIGFDSIESIHNSIHGLAGRNGHMGVVDYAAFDPVFWLHHVNVDRLFAIWQCINPDLYVTPLKSEAGTFTRKPGEIENVESPLTPFRHTADTFWTSTEVRDTTTFKYTYPELFELQSLPKEQKTVQILEQVKKLYGPIHAPVPDPSSKEPISHHEWFINIAVEKYAAKSTFFVHFFLGDPGSDHGNWGSHENLVGSHVVFANNAEYTGCHKCRHAHEHKKVVTGQIPITGDLAKRLGGVNNLTPETVVAYLHKHLDWRIQKHDSVHIPAKDIHSLKITVGSTIVEHPAQGGVGSWGDVKIHKEAIASHAGTK